MSWSGTVRCSNCYKTGHNRRGCPELHERMKKRLEEDPDDYRAAEYFKAKTRANKRTCSYCSGEGHNRRTCTVIQKDRTFLADHLATARPHIMQKFAEIGFGIGALVRDDHWGHVCLVENIDWAELTHDHVPDEMGHSTYSYARRVPFVARKITDGQRCSFNMTLNELAKSVLSPTNKDGRRAPKGWSQGTIYDEYCWFDKASSRSYFFVENNALSS